MMIEKNLFGTSRDGHPVYLYTLNNSSGTTVKITNYGGIVTSLSVPDSRGRITDIVLGFDTLDAYLQGHPYFGTIVGRVANRISNAQFTLDGVVYKLAANDGMNHLHGGPEGFDKKVWDVEEFDNGKETGISLYYFSKNGDEGYPGNLHVTVTYSLTRDNRFKIYYEAETDRATPVNLTHHSYFNLKGAGSGDILDHVLTIHAGQYAPVDHQLIPTGQLVSVKDTPMDFTTPTAIGKRIADVTGGYDTFYMLNSIEPVNSKLRLAAEVYEPNNGRAMDVYTTEPGVQFYTANFLDGSIIGKEGKTYCKHYGFCLETQHPGDALNKPQFPPIILRPGKIYYQTTIYQFKIVP